MASTMAECSKPRTINFVYDSGCRQDQMAIDTLPSPPLSTAVSPASSSSSPSPSSHDSYPFDMSQDLDIQSALWLARNSEDDIDSKVTNFLEDQVKAVWRRLQAKPDSYIMDRDEFALFNFYIYRFRGSEITEKAIDRFWRSHRGPDIDMS
ncbi:hypothetical protein MBLNU457_3769t1 [Dothideomycetes sp. NU457]